MSLPKASHRETQSQSEFVRSVRNDDVGSANIARKIFVVLEPERPWYKLDLEELWNYRELLYFLAWRDVKVRYKQTALGALWAILQPLLAMLIVTLLFSSLKEVSAGNLPYPLFAYSGLVLWVFFANSVIYSSTSLIGNTNLLTKVYFPRILIPTAAVLACTLDFLISCTLLVPLSLWFGVKLSASALLAPVFVLLTVLLATGVGLFMSALCVKYRDVPYALPFAVQLLMFVSSVITPPNLLPETFRWLFLLNPLTGLIESFRTALFGGLIEWTAVATATVLTLVVCSGALLYFRRVERDFADIV